MAKQSSILRDMDSQGPELRRMPSTELTVLAAEVMQSLHATGVAIVNESGEGEMVCVASRGPSVPSVGTPSDVNSGISGRCIREGRSLLSHDTLADPRVNRDVCERLGIRSLAIVPLFRDSRCIGFLEVVSDHARAFDLQSLRVLEENARLASHLGEVPIGAPESSESPVTIDVNESCPDNSRTMTEFAITINSPRPAAKQSEVEPSAFRRTRAKQRRYVQWGVILGAALLAGTALWRVGHHGNAKTPSVTEKPLVPTASFTSLPDIPTAPVQPASGTATESTDKSEVAKGRPSWVRELVKNAKSGDKRAQFLLANHYAKGDFVPRDRVKATVWYILASSLGNMEANRAAAQITRELQPFEIAQTRFDVGRMFMQGVGTSADSATAYYWFVLARAAGDVRANLELAKLTPTMTASEIFEAQQRADVWLNFYSLKDKSGNSLSKNLRQGGAATQRTWE